MQYSNMKSNIVSIFYNCNLFNNIYRLGLRTLCSDTKSRRSRFISLSTSSPKELETLRLAPNAAASDAVSPTLGFRRRRLFSGRRRHRSRPPLWAQTADNTSLSLPACRRERVSECRHKNNASIVGCECSHRRA